MGLQYDVEKVYIVVFLLMAVSVSCSRPVSSTDSMWSPPPGYALVTLSKGLDFSPDSVLAYERTGIQIDPVEALNRGLPVQMYARDSIDVRILVFDRPAARRRGNTSSVEPQRGYGIISDWQYWIGKTVWIATGQEQLGERDWRNLQNCMGSGAYSGLYYYFRQGKRSPTGQDLVWTNITPDDPGLKAVEQWVKAQEAGQGAHIVIGTNGSVRGYWEGDWEQVGKDLCQSVRKEWKVLKGVQ